MEKGAWKMTFITDLLMPNFNFNSIVGGLLIILGIILALYGMFTALFNLIYVGIGFVGVGLILLYGFSFIEDIAGNENATLVTIGLIILALLTWALFGGKKKKRR